MAAFEKDSKISLKGTEITLTDLVVESKKSKVIFKSSGNDKVTCELVSPAEDVEPFVRRSLTVVGKVSGRDILGNVTLDECNLVKEPTAEASHERSEEPTVEAITCAARPVSTALLPPAGLVQAPKPNAGPLSVERLSPRGPAQANKPIAEASTSNAANGRYAFYAFAAVLVGPALLVFVKLRPTFIRTQSWSSPDSPNTPETRRVALEALLLKEKKMNRRAPAQSKLSA